MQDVCWKIIKVMKVTHVWQDLGLNRIWTLNLRSYSPHCLPPGLSSFLGAHVQYNILLINFAAFLCKYGFCQKKIKFISSSQCVMFFLLYRQNDIDKMKYKFWREISEITSPIKSHVRLWKIKLRVPGVVFMNFMSGIFSTKTLLSIY